MRTTEYPLVKLYFDDALFLNRIAQMWPIATDVARSVVFVSVCALAHGDLCKNGWTDRDVIWNLTHVGPGNHMY